MTPWQTPPRPIAEWGHVCAESGPDSIGTVTNAAVRDDEASHRAAPPGVSTLALPPKRYDEPSVFLPENLLREGRRQRGLSDEPVPRVALLDPDGDIARYVVASGSARRHPGWACYHTQMLVTDLDGDEVGIVGGAVGGPFAVLVAEQLAVSGADLVVSMTSAGVIRADAQLPCFVLIDRALRDEGTSANYVPPAMWSSVSEVLHRQLAGAYDDLSQRVLVGTSWTTDAPYRETASALAVAEDAGVCCVEMEAASLYAYARARLRDVVCLAHLTNTMATAGDDFEKGDDNGAPAALAVVAATVAALRGGSP